MAGYSGPLCEALIKKLDGEIAIAVANVEVYKTNPAGIGEHPDVVEAIETQVAKIAEAEDKMSDGCTEVGVETEGETFLTHHRANDQGKSRWNTKWIIKHQL